MRVLVSSVPGLGHLHPVLPVALAAAVAGHDVRVATGADEGLRDVRDATGAGGGVRQVGDAYLTTAVRRLVEHTGPRSRAEDATAALQALPGPTAVVALLERAAAG